MKIASSKKATIALSAAFALFAPALAGAQSEGEKLYMAKCASCHAKDGSGDTPRGKTMKIPNLRSPEIRKKTDDQLVEGIAKSKIHSGIQKQMKSEDIRKTVIFIRNVK